MNQIERALQIIATYQKHGWQLRRVLLSNATRAEAGDLNERIFGDAQIHEAAIAALWFARPSHQNREAWELRLIAEAPYALFETFEADESEEDREEVRQEMEAKMREHGSLAVVPAAADISAE